ALLYVARPLAPARSRWQRPGRGRTIRRRNAHLRHAVGDHPAAPVGHRGRPVTGSTDLLDTLKRAPAIVAIAVLVSAAITAFVLPALALAPAYRTAGLAVMLAPAIYIGIALSFSVPALVLAQKGVLASLAYSFRLVRGNWWRVTAIYIVGLMVVLTLLILVASITTIALADNGAGDAAITRAITSAAFLAVMAVGLTFWSALNLALFGDLQIRRMTSSTGR